MPGSSTDRRAKRGGGGLLREKRGHQQAGLLRVSPRADGAGAAGEEVALRRHKPLIAALLARFLHRRDRPAPADFHFGVLGIEREEELVRISLS